MHSYWLDWDCYTPFFVTEFWPFSDVRFSFLLKLKNKLIEFNQILYTRSWLKLFHIIFCTFVTELWPLTDVIISFPLNILRTN